MKVRRRASLKTKLTLSLLAVAAVSAAGAFLVGRAIIERNLVDQAYEEVGRRLAAFRDLYDNRLYVKHRLLSTVAAYPAFGRDVRAGNGEEIRRVIRELLRESTFDILNVTDAEGRVLVRSRHESVSGDSVARDAYVRRVMSRKVPVWGFDVMSREELLPEGNGLAGRAAIRIIPTDRARRTTREVETRGMFLKAASPIFCDGEFVGVIYGALLLNGDESIPDRARDLVFGGEEIDGRDIGSVTLMLEDVRVSTSVKDREGRRAIGTLVSSEVYDRVFVRGEAWRDQAFVVDRWVIAAYQPVRDADGMPLGIIYAGVLEEKYDRIKREALTSLLFVLGVSGLVSAGLAGYLVHHLARPIQSLVKAAEEVARGRYAKVKPVSADELGYLTGVFNKMVDALEEKDRRLADRVERQFQQTEKMASLGRLASGIAHEINNPLTGVLVYCESLREELAGTPHAEDLDVIRGETLRCRDIVKGILDFARETRLETTRANLNTIITDVLLILEKHVNFQNVRIVRNLDPSLPDSTVDVNQIKSVVNNLAVNAADAMPEGGTLTFTTATANGGRAVHVRVEDTGCGISPENLDRVYDPFFTTKETGKGTGLGLSVTYGIVKRHNGSIRISSEVGTGTTVDITLPAAT